MHKESMEPTRMTIAIVLGTRPEIIKLSPIIHELTRTQREFFILHTGQHYSPQLDQIFFDQLALPSPTYNLAVGSGSHAHQTGTMMIGIETVLLREAPEWILVEGDTNTVVSGTLAAAKVGVPIGHVEAGLRSYDRSMPEEINRIIADHCATLLFAPTDYARQTLRGEGLPRERIHVTGNTIVDVIEQHHPTTAQTRRVETLMTELDLQEGGYFLVTLHRQENVDSPSRLRQLIHGLDQVQDTYKYPIIYPIHPRTQTRLNALQLQPTRVRLIPPLDYLTFLHLERHAKLVLTDSGGVQEETCILHVPCVTLRENTERPETLQVGSNILAGVEAKAIVSSVGTMLQKATDWVQPFGDGHAGRRIVTILGDATD
jgi:UDP-N-acetylglucosamine 2-epimerase (non-hydrolysing)